MNTKIKNRILFALFLGILYFLSDMLLSSFLEGSEIDSSYSRVAILTFIIVFSILLSYLFLPNTIEREKVSKNSAPNISHSTIFNKINRTLMSTSLSLDNRLKKVCELVNEHYSFGRVIISLEKDGDLDIVNYDRNIDNILGSKKLYSIKSEEYNEKRSLLSKIIANQYLKQVGFTIRKIEPPIQDLNIWGLVNIGLISKNNSKLVGLVTILLKDRKIFNEIVEQDIKVLADDLSFFVCFDKQKKVMLKEYERNKKDLEFAHDLTLHISKHSVVNTILNLEAKRASRYNSKLSIIIFQIDNLKSIENAFSEEIALNVKKELVSSVQKNIRELDTLGVWSGDRFIVVAPETDGDGAYQFAEKLANDINATRFKDVNKITCSFGIAWFIKSSGDSELELVRRAETALEQASITGGNKIIFM